MRIGLIGEFLAELAAVLALAVAPAPVHSRNSEFRIAGHIGHPLTGQLLAHGATGDLALEPGEDRLEGRRCSAWVVIMLQSLLAL